MGMFETPAHTAWPASVLPGIIEEDNRTLGIASFSDPQRSISRPQRQNLSRAVFTAAFLLIYAVVAIVITCHKAIGRDPLLFKAVRRLAVGGEPEGEDEAAPGETESCLDTHEHAFLSAEPKGHPAGSQARAYMTGERPGFFSETGSPSETEHLALESQDPESRIVRSIAEYQRQLEASEVDASALITELDMPSFWDVSSLPEEPTSSETASPEKGFPLQAIEGRQLHSFAQSGAAPSIVLASELSSSVGITGEHEGPQTSAGSRSRRRVLHEAESVESEVPGGVQAPKRRRTPSSESKPTSPKRSIEGFLAPTSPSDSPTPAEAHGAEKKDDTQQATTSAQRRLELSLSAPPSSSTTSSPASAAAFVFAFSPTPSTSHEQSSAARESEVAGVSQVLLSGASDASASGETAADSGDISPVMPSEGLRLCQLPRLQRGEGARRFRRNVVFSDQSRRWAFPVAKLKKVFPLLLQPTISRIEGNQLVKFGEEIASVLTRKHKSPVKDEDVVAALATLARRYLLLDTLLCVTRILPDQMNADEWWAEEMSQIASEFPLLKIRRADTYPKVALGKRLSRAVELLKQGQSPPDHETAYLKTVLLLKKKGNLFPNLKLFNWTDIFGDEVIDRLLSFARRSERYERKRELLLKSQAAFALPQSAPPMLSGAPVFYRLPAGVDEGMIAEFQKEDSTSKSTDEPFGLDDLLSAYRWLRKIHLSTEEAGWLVKFCQRAVWHLEESQLFPVDDIDLECATRYLGYRFLLLDAVFCTIQVLPSQMNAQNWWIAFLKLVPTKRSADAADSEENQRLAQLAKRLGAAMELLKEGIRPVQEETVSLKKALLLDPESPLGLTPRLLERFRNFAVECESRHLD